MVAVPVLLSSHDVVVGGEADVRDLAADAELFLAFLLLESKAISSAILLTCRGSELSGSRTCSTVPISWRDRWRRWVTS